MTVESPPSIFETADVDLTKLRERAAIRFVCHTLVDDLGAVGVVDWHAMNAIYDAATGTLVDAVDAARVGEGGDTDEQIVVADGGRPDVTDAELEDAIDAVASPYFKSREVADMLGIPARSAAQLLRRRDVPVAQWNSGSSTVTWHYIPEEARESGDGHEIETDGGTRQWRDADVEPPRDDSRGTLIDREGPDSEDWRLVVTTDGEVEAQRTVPYEGTLRFTTASDPTLRTPRKNSQGHLSVDEVLDRYHERAHTEHSRDELERRVEDVRTRTIVTDGGNRTVDELDPAVDTLHRPTQAQATTMVHADERCKQLQYANVVREVGRDTLRGDEPVCSICDPGITPRTADCSGGGELHAALNDASPGDIGEFDGFDDESGDDEDRPLVADGGQPTYLADAVQEVAERWPDESGDDDPTLLTDGGRPTGRDVELVALANDAADEYAAYREGLPQCRGYETERSAAGTLERLDVQIDTIDGSARKEFAVSYRVRHEEGETIATAKRIRRKQESLGIDGWVDQLARALAGADEAARRFDGVDRVEGIDGELRDVRERSIEDVDEDERRVVPDGGHDVRDPDADAAPIDAPDATGAIDDWGDLNASQRDVLVATAKIEAFASDGPAIAERVAEVVVDVLGSERSAVTVRRQIRRLTEAGILERHHDADDPSTANRYTLTEEGWQLLCAQAATMAAIRQRGGDHLQERGDRDE